MSFERFLKSRGNNRADMNMMSAGKSFHKC